MASSKQKILFIEQKTVSYNTTIRTSRIECNDCERIRQYPQLKKMKCKTKKLIQRNREIPVIEPMDQQKTIYFAKDF